MSLKLRLIKDRSLEWYNRKPGDIWFLTYLVEDSRHKDETTEPELFKDYDLEMYRTSERILSPNYLRDWWGKRPPLCIKLPDGTDWCPDAPAQNNPQGWTVTGEVPNVTVRASIDTGLYHGYITNGLIEDDLNKRTYDK